MRIEIELDVRLWPKADVQTIRVGTEPKADI